MFPQISGLSFANLVSGKKITLEYNLTNSWMTCKGYDAKVSFKIVDDRNPTFIIFNDTISSVTTNTRLKSIVNKIDSSLYDIKFGSTYNLTVEVRSSKPLAKTRIANKLTKTGLFLFFSLLFLIKIDKITNFLKLQIKRIKQNWDKNWVYKHRLGVVYFRGAFTTFHSLYHWIHLSAQYKYLEQMSTKHDKSSWCVQRFELKLKVSNNSDHICWPRQNINFSRFLY